VRVLILTQYYPPEIGAPQTRLAALARELSARGHQVEVVTAMPNHLTGTTFSGYRRRWYMRERVAGTTVHRSWVYPATGTGVRRMLNYLSFCVSALYSLLRVERADVVFVESPPLFLGVPGWLVAKLHRARFVFNVADLWPDAVRELGVLKDGFLFRAARGLEEWTYRRATVVNAVTEGISHDLRVRKGVPESKLRFLPNGVDCVAFAPRRGSAQLAERLRIDGRPVFLYAGTHGIAQGLHNVLSAAEQCPEAVMVFVGDGVEKAALVRAARERGIGNVRFVDPVPLDEMPEYFSLACASIVPLLRRDLHQGARPSKLFPSFACGVPVIYSGEGEGARIVSEAGAGLVVPPEDPGAIAGAMRALGGDAALRAQMSERARALAIDRFAWPAIVERWLGTLPQ